MPIQTLCRVLFSQSVAVQIARTCAPFLLFGGVAVALVLLVAPASAFYATSWDESRWQPTSGALKCELSHPISGFGEARLVRRAGGADQLILRAKKGLTRAAYYSVATRAPMWRSESTSAQLGRVHAPGDIVIQGALLRAVLSELAARQHVDFIGDTSPSAAANAQARRFIVSLTPRNFEAAYVKFGQCVAAMIPFSFGQIAKHSFNYRPDAADLSALTKSQLDKMLRYSEADAGVLGFIVDAHSNAEAEPHLSQAQAQLQADLIADYLQNAGYSDAKILRRVHGDKFPIASNATAAGQAKNRRVTVRLEDEQLRRARTQRVAAQQRLDALAETRAEAEATRAQAAAQAEQAAAAAQEKNRADYAEIARRAMGGAATGHRNSSLGAEQVIRKSKPGISIEEVERLIEGQDLKQPRQPRIEIRLE